MPELTVDEMLIAYNNMLTLLAENMINGGFVDSDDALEYNRLPTITFIREKVGVDQLPLLQRRVESEADSHVAALAISMMTEHVHVPAHAAWLCEQWTKPATPYVKSCLAWSLLDAVERGTPLRNEALEFLRGTHR